MKKAIKYIDIHGHINFPEYDADREEVIARTAEAGVGMIVVGTDIESSRKAVEIAETHENMWATVGIHPTEINMSKVESPESKVHKVEYKERSKEAKRKDKKNDALAQNVSSAATQDERRLFRHERSDMRKSTSAVVGGADQVTVSEFQELRRLALHPKVVAIGECGLDYFHCQEADIPAQIEAFEKHIAIANEAKKPLMLHVRNSQKKGDSTAAPTSIKSSTNIGGNAYKDALNILKKLAKVPFDFHFFAGSMEDMKNIIKVGGTVSFTGVLTFTHDYDELVKTAPIDRIMSETDCPYVAPVPHRGKRNEPIHAIEVVKAIARIRGEDEEKVRAILLENARRFFSIQDGILDKV